MKLVIGLSVLSIVGASMVFIEQPLEQLTISPLIHPMSDKMIDTINLLNTTWKVM